MIYAISAPSSRRHVPITSASAMSCRRSFRGSRLRCRRPPLQLLLLLLSLLSSLLLLLLLQRSTIDGVSTLTYNQRAAAGPGRAGAPRAEDAASGTQPTALPLHAASKPSRPGRCVCGVCIFAFADTWPASSKRPCRRGHCHRAVVRLGRALLLYRLDDVLR